jgi:hypothetical protein
MKPKSPASPWTAKQVTRWEKTRVKGKVRFVFVNGALSWGGFMILSTNLVHDLPKQAFDGAYFIGSLLIYPLGGILCGLLMWNRLEAAYQRNRSQEELEVLEHSCPLA